MTKECCICKKTGPSIKLHRFPNPNLFLGTFLKWVQAAQDPNHVTWGYRKIYRRSYVCQDHFLSTDFQPFTDRIYKNTVPSQKLPEHRYIDGQACLIDLPPELPSAVHNVTFYPIMTMPECQFPDVSSILGEIPMPNVVFSGKPACLKIIEPEIEEENVLIVKKEALTPESKSEMTNSIQLQNELQESQVENSQGNTTTILINMENLSRSCRTCLAESVQLTSIFTTYIGEAPVLELLNTCVLLKLEKDDLLPQFICMGCLDVLKDLNAFRKKSQANEMLLRTLLGCFEETEELDSLKENDCEEVIKDTGSKSLIDISSAEIKDESLSIAVEQEVNMEQDSAKPEISFAPPEENVPYPTKKSPDDTQQPIPPNVKLSKWYCRKCPAGSVPFASEKDFEFHKKEAHAVSNEIIVCELCGASMRRRARSKHMGRFHSGRVQYTCQDCPTLEPFVRLMDYRRHRKFTHPPVPQSRLCEICAEIVPPNLVGPHMRRHQKRPRPPNQCHICSRIFSQGANLRRHIQSHTKEFNFLCEMCGKGFIQLVTLNEHMKTHVGREQLVCEKCGHIPKTAYDLCICMREAGVRRRRLRYPCPSDLNGTHKCELCDKSFRSNLHLNTHRYNVHTVREIPCTFCDKLFKTRSALKVHMVSHTGVKRFQCHLCLKGYSQVGYLKLHMRTHYNIRPFKCSECRRTFAQKAHLRTHLKTHTGERPYACPYCGRAFALNGNLTSHIRIHTGETPFICERCKRGFCTSSVLKRHRCTGYGVD